jgi:hypothetical protein
MYVGVSMTLPGRGENELYYGYFLCFCGDYISCAQASGTKESPSRAKRFCRACMVRRDGNDLAVIDFCGNVPFPSRLRTQTENITHVALTNSAALTSKEKRDASTDLGVSVWGATFQEPWIPHGKGVETCPQDLAHNYLGGQYAGMLHLTFKKLFKDDAHPNFTRYTPTPTSWCM